MRIATIGRPAIVSAMLAHFKGQTRAPDSVFVCPASARDYDHGGDSDGTLCVMSTRTGSSSQRNRILDEMAAFDAIVFFDDDFFPAPTFLAEVERCFEAYPDVAGMSGHVMIDGAHGAGFSVDDAHAALEAYRPEAVADAIKDQFNAYGCNMALRLDPIRANGLVFDETLPLYGWFEDVDLCRRLARHGRIVWNARLASVHLGAKNGRTPGVKLGYSQVANPIYLFGKGSVPWRWTLEQVMRNVVANGIKAVNPEPWCDRRGRLRGNLLALADLARGTLDPRRITTLS